MNEPRLVAYLDDTEPLTLAQARLQCRIDAEGSPPSHPDDDLLAAFVAVAREQVERFFGQMSSFGGGPNDAGRIRKSSMCARTRSGDPYSFFEPRNRIMTSIARAETLVICGIPGGWWRRKSRLDPRDVGRFAVEASTLDLEAFKPIHRDLVRLRAVLVGLAEVVRH